MNEMPIEGNDAIEALSIISDLRKSYNYFNIDHPLDGSEAGVMHAKMMQNMLDQMCVRFGDILQNPTLGSKWMFLLSNAMFVEQHLTWGAEGHWSEA